MPLSEPEASAKDIWPTIIIMSVGHKTYILGQYWMHEMLFKKMPYNQTPFF